MCFPTLSNSSFLSNECCLHRHLWIAFSEGCLMVKSISSCLIRTAAGTAPTLTARDSSQLFSVGKVWRSLLKHSSILKFSPLFSWTALKLHKGLVTSWLMVIHIHQTRSTRRPLGEKWQTRRFNSYVLLVPANGDSPMARPRRSLCASSLVCGWVSDSSSQVAPQPLLQALAQIQHHVSMLMLSLWSSLKCAGQTPHTHPTTTSDLFLLGFPLSSVSLHSFWQPTASSGKNRENPPALKPCTTDSLLTLCLEQIQPLLWIGKLQGSVC